jgi:hypothetical protein
MPAMVSDPFMELLLLEICVLSAGKLCAAKAISPLEVKQSPFYAFFTEKRNFLELRIVRIKLLNQQNIKS